jgi:anti-anti-sigma regulatory factor
MSTAKTLPAEISIYCVSELRSQWLVWLDEANHEGPCEVDASQVAEVDAAGIQLLLSLAAALLRRDASLQLLQPSAALRAACEALGLQSLLPRGGSQ